MRTKEEIELKIRKLEEFEHKAIRCQLKTTAYDLGVQIGLLKWVLE